MSSPSVATPSRNARMRIVEPAKPRPLEERGQIWYARDVQRVYGEDVGGRPRKSIDWIHKHVAPDARHKDGKTPWWWSNDVLQWMDRQREAR